MAFQFPNNPTIGQSVLNPTSSQYYTWNGTVWTQYPTSASYAISSSYSVTSSFALNGGGAGGTTISISDNAPTGSAANSGSLWFNSNNLGLYVRYNDGDSTQWVAASAVGPVSTASFATSASVATLARTASFVATASTAITASHVPNNVIAYLIPNTATTAQWVLLGTWSTFQDGCTLSMNLSAHSGFNAQTTQNQTTTLNLVTSNGVSTNATASGAGFYLSGLASSDVKLGSSTFAPSLIRIVQVSTTSYQVYGYFGTFSANSHYTISVSPGTTWTNSGTLPGTTPGGLFLDIVPSQIGGSPTLEFRRTLTTGLALTTDIPISWNTSDTNSITSLSHNSGIFTNTTSTTRTYIIDYQSAARLANTGLLINEFNMFIIKGTGTPTPSSTNRIAEYVSQPNNSAFALKRLSTVITLAPNEVFRCYQYITATGATTWTSSDTEFGYAAGASTRIKVTEL